MSLLLQLSNRPADCPLFVQTVRIAPADNGAPSVSLVKVAPHLGHGTPSDADEKMIKRDATIHGRKKINTPNTKPHTWGFEENNFPGRFEGYSSGTSASATPKQTSGCMPTLWYTHHHHHHPDVHGCLYSGTKITSSTSVPCQSKALPYLLKQKSRIFCF